jgi:hypothetical protein
MQTEGSKMTISADTLRFWTASKALLNPATPADEADEAGMALLSIAVKGTSDKLFLRAWDIIDLANEQGRLNFSIDIALEA